MKAETIERYAVYLFDLVEDLASINISGDIPEVARKLKDRAVYLIYSMNMKEQEEYL